MSNVLNEELGRMKSLFSYQKGRVISEQNVIPGGISQQAYDKIISVSQQNKKQLKGSYLAPLEQRKIDAEFGAGTYEKFFNNGGKDVLDKKEVSVPEKKVLPEVPLPDGVSKPAVDKIMSISQQNKKQLKGSYLAPLEQRKIDAEFGAGTYEKFFNNGGKDVLDGKKVFKSDTPAVNNKEIPAVTANTREQNIKNALSKVVNGVIVSPGSKVDKMKWTDYVAKYKVTPEEIKKITGKSNVRAKVNAPKEMGNVTAFQDWLDANHPGWATGYKDGKIDKGNNGKGYGSYGPRTQKAWKDYGQEYIKKDVGSPTVSGSTQTVDDNDGENIGRPPAS